MYYYKRCIFHHNQYFLRSDYQFQHDLVAKVERSMKTL